MFNYNLFVEDTLYYHTIVQASDERLKENIADCPSELAKILSLRPATYIFKRDSKRRTQFGFIAQQVENVYPELVSEFADPRDGVTYKGLKYVGRITPLIKAVQEQSRSIESQNKRIEALEAAVNSDPSNQL